jgi:hypothetical protein
VVIISCGWSNWRKKFEFEACLEFCGESLFVCKQTKMWSHKSSLKYVVISVDSRIFGLVLDLDLSVATHHILASFIEPRRVYVNCLIKAKFRALYVSMLTKLKNGSANQPRFVTT